MALVLPLALGAQGPAQSGLPRLTDKQPFAVRGRLRIVYGGWHRYLVIALDKPYLADFGAEDGGTKRVTALELNPQGDSQKVARYAGSVVEARGRLQLEGVSPYYWNGVMLMAETTKLPDGTTVVPANQAAAVVPAGTQMYLVTVTMVPHQFAWRYQAVDLASHQPLPDAHVDGCGLNGGGDVMNCFCVGDFTPLRGGAVAHPLPPDLWQQVPRSELRDGTMAQFDLPDPDARRPQTVQLVCKRKDSHHE